MKSYQFHDTDVKPKVVGCFIILISWFLKKSSVVVGTAFSF